MVAIIGAASAAAEILNVRVGSKPRVVREVPTDVIGIFLLTPLAVYQGLLFGQLSLANALCLIGLTAIAVVVALRVALLRGPAADHRTYILYSYWYCAILASMVVVA